MDSVLSVRLREGETNVVRRRVTSDFIPCKQALIKELTSLFFFAHLRS